MRLADDGRCCGKKPLEYKGGSWRSPSRPQYFCSRCNRAYDYETKEQFANFAWAEDTTGFKPMCEKAAIAAAEGTGG